MPPLHPSSTFDLAAAIPFADNAPSSFDKLFDLDISQQQHNLDHQQQSQYDQHAQQTSHDDVPQPPSEAEISALFGLPPVSAPTPQQPTSHQYSQQYHPTPTHMAPAPREAFSPASLPASRSMATTYVPENEQNISQFNNNNDTTPQPFQNHQYYQPPPPPQQLQPQPQPQQPQQQQQQQQQQQNYQYTPYHQYNPNQVNVNGYSVVTADYSNMYGNDQYGSTLSDVNLTSSSNSQSASNPMMLNAPSRSIFSRFGGGGSTVSSGLCNENQGISAPKIAKVAASYVSSTLAVTSTFASEKIATASTKIADLWQHNQYVLPQQQNQHENQQQNQQQQQSTLYNHGDYYNTDAPTINSGCGNHTNVNPDAYSYDNNSNYQSLSHKNKNPFATITTSKLSNVATVAGSYLPTLSKLPTLPALPALPALSIPWGSRDKNQQLPQQQPHSQQLYYNEQPNQQSNQQHYSSSEYYGTYTSSQEQAYQQQTYIDQPDNPTNYQTNGSTLAATGNWWGEIRNEMQKGRRMVTTGVQAGVAWWWDSDTKNPLGNFV